MSYYDFLSSFNLLKFDRFLFIDVANTVFNWKSYPYFLVVHSIGVCLSLRNDMSDRGFSRRHPLSCWCSSMLSIFSGMILTNFLIGDAILNPLKHQNYILAASLAWYLIFYSPFDIAYYIADFLPIKLCIMGAKEIYRCKSIYDGISLATRLYPQSYLIILILGTIRGVGSLILRNFERSVRGLQPSSASEILQPSVSTKLSLLSAIVFLLHKTGLGLTSIPTPILFFSVACFMVYFRISLIFWDMRDPFKGLENLVCAVFFGGIWDTLQKAIKRRMNLSGPTSSKSHPNFWNLWNLANRITSKSNKAHSSRTSLARKSSLVAGAENEINKTRTGRNQSDGEREADGIPETYETNQNGIESRSGEKSSGTRKRPGLIEASSGGYHRSYQNKSMDNNERGSSHSSSSNNHVNNERIAASVDRNLRSKKRD